MTNIPEGYELHDGKGCPVDPEAYVDAIIRTSEGLGHSGILKAKYHQWDFPDGEVGNVVGYRVAKNGDSIDLTKRWVEEGEVK